MSQTPTTGPTRHRPPHMKMTEERKRIFIATLAKTGSYRAAAAASGHLVKDGNPNSRFSVGAFAALAKRDPEFAEQVQQSLSEAVANVEHAIYDRIHRPNRRPVLDRQGNIVAWDENWRDANLLALRFLERHDPAWVQKKQIDGTTHVVHSDGDIGSGAAYILKPNDILLLPPEKRGALIALLEEIEQAREGPVDALPAPTPAALPGPVEEAANGAS